MVAVSELYVNLTRAIVSGFLCDISSAHCQKLLSAAAQPGLLENFGRTSYKNSRGSETKNEPRI